MKQALDQFDGKHTAPLESLAGRLSPDARTLTELCRIARTGTTKQQGAATWILNHLTDRGPSLKPTQTKRILALLGDVSAWEAAVHLLKMLPKMSIPKENRATLHRDLRALIRDENKFVRAWAFNGVFVLADQYPEHQREAKKLLQIALLDEPASVKARVRNAIKQADWIKPT